MNGWIGLKRPGNGANQINPRVATRVSGSWDVVADGRWGSAMKSRMFRAAVISAIENMPSCPKTMEAVDIISDGFSSIDSMLEYLWKYPDSVQWGSLFGIEYSPRKQAAIFTLTGHRWENGYDKRNSVTRNNQ